MDHLQGWGVPLRGAGVHIDRRRPKLTRTRDTVVPPGRPHRPPNTSSSGTLPGSGCRMDVLVDNTEVGNVDPVGLGIVRDAMWVGQQRVFPLENSDRRIFFL